MLQGQVLPTPTTPPRTRRGALELYAAFSFSRYVIVPWRVCSICIYVYPYMNVCLYSVNIYIYTYFLMLISCYYMCKYVSFRTRRISGAIWGGQRTSTSTIWFIPWLVVATMTQNRWVGYPKFHLWIWATLTWNVRILENRWNMFVSFRGIREYKKSTRPFFICSSNMK